MKRSTNRDELSSKFESAIYSELYHQGCDAHEVDERIAAIISDHCKDIATHILLTITAKDMDAALARRLNQCKHGYDKDDCGECEMDRSLTFDQIHGGRK